MLRLATCTFIGLSMAACAGDDAAQGGQQGGNEDKLPAGATIFSSVDQSDTSEESAPFTRTSISDHVKGGGAKVNWSATDKIWAKDDNGTWQQSGAASIPNSTKKSFARFALGSAFTQPAHAVIYTNLPISGTTAQVEIKAAQTQSAPNNFDHAGESGDCGIAEARENLSSGYDFTLNHKASYLCLIPRSSNAFVHRSKLTKIEILSDDNIAGTYDMAADGTLTLASGGSKTITLTTGTGFDLDNTADDMDKNAAYAVIAPGTHSLRIRYWLSNDVDNPAGTIEGTVTKYVTLTFVPGQIHDITANLALNDYPANDYYMWDAKLQYWHGYEWNSSTPGQPTVKNTLGFNHPVTTADNRWYNESYPGDGVRNDASQNPLFSTIPNVNEMTWYAMQGDPHWDADELWTTMGHLYKGGMWFKKKAHISGFTDAVAHDGTDYRITKAVTLAARNNSVASGRPSAADLTRYFYLPATGYYMVSFLRIIETNGCYWSSSAHPSNQHSAYSMNFRKNDVVVGEYVGNREAGERVVAFE